MSEITRRIYLDYAAGTPIDPRVLRVMAHVLRDSFGNPASVHHEGVLAKKILDESRRKVALVLGCHPDEVIFTGSGTEANNLAIFGVVDHFHFDSGVPYNELHIITSAVEHSSVKKCFEELRDRGVKVTVVSVGGDGLISPRAVISALTKDTVFISMVLANNEIGTTQPIRRIALDLQNEAARRKFKFGRPILHTDASQALCYLNSSADSLRADMITIDGQKVYGPKGIGALYHRRKTPLKPIMHGGGQEQGIRPGTENVPLIAGLAEAISIASKIREKEAARLLKIRDYLIREIGKIFPRASVNGSIAKRLPNNLNILLPGVNAEFLVLKLDAAGFALSTKSACVIGEESSYVLKAIGRSEAEAKSSLRISLGRFTKLGDVRRFVKELGRILSEGHILV